MSVLERYNKIKAEREGVSNESNAPGRLERYKKIRAEKDPSYAAELEKQKFADEQAEWAKSAADANAAVDAAKKQYDYATSPDNATGKLWRMIHGDYVSGATAEEAAAAYANAKDNADFYKQYPTLEGYLDAVELYNKTAELQKAYTEEAGRAAWDEIKNNYEDLPVFFNGRKYYDTGNSEAAGLDYGEFMKWKQTAPSESWSDAEKYEYAYLKKNGGDWETYARRLNLGYASASREKEKKEREEFAKTPIGGVLTTAEIVLLGGIEGLGDYLNQLIYPGMKDYSEHLSMFDASQAGVSAISDKLNEMGGTIDESVPVFGGKGLGDAYQLGNSILQSALVGFATGGAGNAGKVLTFVNFFGQASAAGINEAKAKGATDGEAMAYGTLAGVFEGLFEELSLDKVIKINTSPASTKELIKNVLKSAGIEASEEAATTMANKISDALILGEKSDLAKETLLSNIEDIIFDAVGGAVSGGVHSGAFMGTNYVSENSRKGSAIKSSGSADMLEEYARQYGTLEDGKNMPKTSVGLGSLATRTEKEMLRDFGKNIGLNISGINALVDGFTTNYDVSEYAEEFLKYYDAGKNGAEMPNIADGMIEKSLGKIAYNEGRIAAIEGEGQAGQDESRFSIKKSADGQIYVDIDTDERFNDLSDAEKAALARKIIKEKFAGKVVGEKGRAFVNGNSAEEYSKLTRKYDSATIDAKMRAANELDNILDAGTNFRNEADGADGHFHSDVIGGFDKFDVVFKVGGDYYSGVINIKNNKQGKLFYDVTQIKNITRDLPDSHGKSPTIRFPNDVSEDIIPESEKNVKENSEKFKAGNIGVAFKGESRAVYESGNASSADYSAAFAEAYKNGYLGRGVGTSFDGIRAKYGEDVISDAQLDDAYQAGADDRAAQRGEIRRGSGKVELNGAKVTSEERDMLRELAAFGKIDIKFDDLEGANGTYKDGVIYIDKHAEHSVAVVLGHEGYHRFREAAPAQAQIIERIAYEAAEKKDPDIAEKTIARYAEAGQIITYADAIEEIAADYVGDAIGTPENFRQIIKQASTQKEKGALSRLWARIRELWNRVKAKFTGEKYEKTVSDADKAIAALEKMMYSAKIGIDTAAETASEGGEKLSVKENYDYSKSFTEQIDDYKNSKFPENDTLIVSGTPKVFQQIGLNPLPMTYTQSHLREALENKDGDHLGESLLKKVPNALEKPIAIIDSSSRPGRLVAIIEIPNGSNKTIAAVEIDGSGKMHGLDIDSNAIVSIYEKENIYSKHLMDAIKSELSGNGGIYYWQKNKAMRNLITSGVQFPGITNLPDGFIRSINDPLSKVNSKIENVTKTKQFKRWFGDSKVVNEDGTPKVVYHGTDAEFTVFDETRGRSTMDIQGMFFSPWELDAQGYGKNVGSYYLSIKNPAPEGVAYKVLNKFKGQNEAGKKAREYLISLGYDGVNNSDEEYIAFYPTQIKSATDNIGTFDGGNPDIRYSLKTSDAEKRVAELAEELERARQSWSENGEFTGSLLPSETQLKKTVDILMDGYAGEKTKKALTAELKELFGDIRKYRDAKTTGYKDKLWEAISPKLDRIAADLCNGRVSAEKDESGLYLYNENMPRAVLAQKLELMYSLFEMPNFVRDDMKAGTDVNKLYEKIKELRTEKEAALEKVREQRRKTVKALKLAETTDAEIDQKYYESEARKKLLRVAKRLSSIKYVNREMTVDGQKVNVGNFIDRAINDVLDSVKSIRELDLVSVSMRSSTKEFLEDLSSWYSEQKNDANFYGDERTEKELARLSKMSIGQMTIRDVEALTDALLNVENTIRTQNKLIDAEDNRNFQEQGAVVINDVNHLAGINKGLWDDIVTESLSPLRAVSRITGYNDDDPLMMRTRELNDGQRNMLSWIVKYKTMFNEYTSDTEYMKKLTGKNADVVMRSGDGIMTRGMLMSLYLHSTNAQNMKHVELGGAVLPNGELYKDGKIRDAYAKKTIVKMSRSQIVKLANEQLDEKDFKFIAAVKRYFNVEAKAGINEVSNKLLGYDLAKVGEYFPISVNGAFTKAEYEQIKCDGSVAGMGNLKERVDSSLPIDLVDITSVLNRAIDLNAKYIGLAVPVRNMSKLLRIAKVQSGTDASGATVLEKVLGGDGFEHYIYDTSVMDAIEKKWGKNGADYIKKMLADVQGLNIKDRNTFTDLFDGLRSNYAQAVLTLNPAVAMKQTASYPTAAAVIGWKALLKGLNAKRHVNLDVVSKYTPLLAYRSLGYTDADLGAIVNRRGRLPKGLNWIQFMDVMTTKRLWAACEYYIEEHKPSLERRSDAYYKAVAEVYNRVIEESQPNYTAMQRPQLLRSNDTLLKNLAMFKTQPMQNLNLIFDAIGNYRAKNAMYTQNPTEENSAALKEAKARLGRVISSQVVQAVMMAAITLGWNAARGKLGRYKDDDDETIFNGKGFARFIIDVVENLGSGIPGASELTSFAESLAGIFSEGKFTYYGIEAATPAMISDMLEGVGNLLVQLTRVVEGGAKTEKVISAAENAASEIAKAFGIPAGNVINMMKIVFRIFGVEWDK